MRKPGLSEELIDIIYPSACVGCGAPHVLPLCASCFMEVACGRSPRPEDNAPSPGVAYGTLSSAGHYSGALKEMVLRLKDSEGRMAAPLAALMVLSLGNDPAFLLPGAVCFVPSTRRKIAERGFNPARLLAVHVASILGRPLADLLCVARSVRDQDSMPGSERWANVRGAYEAQPGQVPPERLLLVDDVLTTGATADACSRALMARGAPSVCVLVAARAVLRRVPLSGPKSPYRTI